FAGASICGCASWRARQFAGAPVGGRGNPQVRQLAGAPVGRRVSGQALQLAGRVNLRPRQFAGVAIITAVIFVPRSTDWLGGSGLSTGSVLSGSRGGAFVRQAAAATVQFCSAPPPWIRTPVPLLHGSTLVGGYDIAAVAAGRRLGYGSNVCSMGVVEVVAAVDAAVDSLAALDFTECPDRDVRDGVAAVVRAHNRLMAQATRLIGEFD